MCVCTCLLVLPHPFLGHFELLGNSPGMSLVKVTDCIYVHHGYQNQCEGYSRTVARGMLGLGLDSMVRA